MVSSTSVGMLLHGLGDSYHFSFSLCVLGETATGKSQLVSCTLPDPPQVPESGDVIADHGIRTRSHTYESRGARYQILMWEVPGAPRYLGVASRYASMAAGLVLVFDRSRRATFDRVALWVKAVEGASPDLPMVLIGNKSDLNEEVSSAEAGILAQQIGATYFETCATKNMQERRRVVKAPPRLARLRRLGKQLRAQCTCRSPCVQRWQRIRHLLARSGTRGLLHSDCQGDLADPQPARAVPAAQKADPDRQAARREQGVPLRPV